ncbi:hypothetical protein BAE44_0023834, partial [Dichanthelium oligosanthes]
LCRDGIDCKPWIFLDQRYSRMAKGVSCQGL